jgi:ECF sigma factor
MPPAAVAFLSVPGDNRNMTDVTQIFDAIERGEPRAADRLIPLVYDELRRLAAVRLRHENPGQTLTATALVHEAFVRLTGKSYPQEWNNAGHFFMLPPKRCGAS